MEIGTPKLRTLLIAATFLVISFVLGLMIWRSFDGPVPLEPKGYRFSMLMPDAADLYPGSAVTVAGVEVGSIVSIDPRSGGARVVAELEDDHAPLRTDTRAIRRTKSLLGEGYVELTPGPARGLTIPDGGALPRSQIDHAQSLDQALEILEPRTRRNLDRLFGGMARAFRGRSDDLNESLERLAPTTAGLDQLLGKLDANRADLQRLFSGSADVLDAVSERQGQLEAAVQAGNRVLATTADRNRELSATMRELPSFLTTLRSAARRLEDTAPDLDAAVSSLLPVAPKLPPALRELDRATPQFQGAFRELTPLLSEGQRSLPSVRRTVRRAGSTLGHAYPVTRELVPFLQLLGELRGSVTGFFANISQAANGTIPLGSRGPHPGLGGIPTFWNETIAGWRKRLPTSRPNPYPKPGASDEIAKGGLLSYDCRHLRNTLFLPPLGPGAPPCRLQGPWTFNGKTHYYPRLQLAPP